MVCHIKKERRLRILEIWVLRKKFGPKREKIADSWGEGNVQEHSQFVLLATYYSGDQIKGNNGQGM
jgi:hypothetical protein